MYRRFLFAFGLTLVSMSSWAQLSDAEINSKVDQLLAKMTVEEKVGQMTQVTLNVICKTPKGGNLYHNLPAEIDDAKLEIALKKYGVGSILNTGTYTLPQETWHELIGKIQKYAEKETRLGIPVIYGIDAIHGANYTVGATLFPQEICLAASWEPDYAEKLGMVTAYEVRASAQSWNFSPVLDLARQPLWSRFFETLGEDPYLASVMGTAIVKGYQGDDPSDPERVAACLKHYVGYSNARSGKDRTPIIMPERMLRQYYLPSFEAAIDQGALSVMVNSSEINGTPVHADYHILTEILKEELEFKGFSVSDWQDIIMLHTVHKIAESEKEATAMSINAGLDMSMVPENYSFADHLVELVNEKKVPMSRIDDAVRRILYVKYKTGLFDKTHYKIKRYPKFGSEEFANYSYEAARDAITLLKNDNNILPLPKGKKVLITGVGGNSLNALNGAWTHTWQGDRPEYNTKGKLTIKEAIEAKIGKDNVSYVQGTDWEKAVDIDKAVEAAKNVDYIIVCTGEKPATEVPGNITDLTLPAAQLELINKMIASGKKVVLVMNQARPRIVHSVTSKIDGIIMAYLSGDEGGRAIADVLFGDANPSGKLPFTYPSATGSITHYDHKFSEQKHIDFSFNAIQPEWEFGHGLSYTTFAYSDLKLSSETITDGGDIVVSVTVKNTGKLEGKEVVQLYTNDEYASITPNVKRLKGFKKITLRPGESKTVSFKLTVSDLAFVDNNNKWITEEGGFKVMIKDLEDKFVYKK